MADEIPVNSSSLVYVDTPVGPQMTLQKTTKVEYQTSSGTTLYDKILTGFKPILFPTAVSRNAVFDYRFSIKDLILPRELPQVTDLYFKDIVVKIQDIFTQVMAQNAISNGAILSYMPYSAVLSQDENGIETEEHEINGKIHKFMNSERLIKRDSSPLFVVSSNLKFNRSFNLDIATNSYKALLIYNEYKEGEIVGKITKPRVSTTPEELRQVIAGYGGEKQAELREQKYTGLYCIDIILCDMLIYCLKSFDLNAATFEDLHGPEDLENAGCSKNVPIGWLTPEEKLAKFGKKGRFTDNFGEENPIPNSLFQYVDMQDRCDKLFSKYRPGRTVFEDTKGVIADFTGHYILANELLSVRVKSDN